MSASVAEIKDRLERFGQAHLLRFIDELPREDRTSFLGELQSLDLEGLASLIDSHVKKVPETEVPGEIAPPACFPLVPDDDSAKALYTKAEARGRRLLSDGKVCALTVAGGQGSRLGFDGPKGAYPITPIKRKTLFQVFAESLRRAREKFSASIPWYIMTSSANDAATRRFFEDNAYFGLEADSVFFFTQGEMPAIGLDGKILLRSKGALAMAPNGHGGTLLALRNSGALDSMREAGVDHISYFQVDNPLVSVVSPVFIGLHDIEGSEMSSRALEKTGPFEKLGNYCVVDGRLTIIEYSDMPAELAEAKDADGRLLFRLGSPAIHVISRTFVERLTGDGAFHLPWHRAEKKVPFLDVSGGFVEPSQPNAVKLETFIFDAIPMAENPIVVEAARKEEFAPVKNKTGVDSAESCRLLLMERDARWLEAAGVEIPRKDDGTLDCAVELSPNSFFDSEDVLARFDSENLVLNPGDERYFD